ncbi:MAG: diacylglycerol/polyprenol kinase family protein [Rudaea sp.]
MPLDFLSNNPLLRDLLATVATLAVALAWLRLMDALAHRGVFEPRLARKVIHIGTGPLFVLCWYLFSDQYLARFLAALVPLSITIQFALVGFGVIRDEMAVQAMTRHNDPREILRGPLYYGIVFVVCTILFWRNSPVGVVALMLMCGGDGLADVVGRRFGSRKLPFSREKSWAGSVAMFLGGLFFALGFVFLMNSLGSFQPSLDMSSAAARITLIALVATAVEALPLHDVDNILITAAAVGLGLLWL